MKKIIVTGATGFIGSKLCNALHKRGDEVFVFSRDLTKAKDAVPFAAEYYEWNYRSPGSWQHLLDGKDAVVHLAGANLSSKRWNDSFKKVILESRQLSTRSIAEAFSRVKNKPKTFVCASAVGYYSDRGNEKLTEQSSAGSDFLSEVVMIWEKEAARVADSGVRTVNMRTGIVLDKDSEVIKKMLLPFKLFVGGPLGSGEQWFPWVHLDDVINIYIEAIDNKNLSGPVNAAAPGIVTMNQFAEMFGEVLKRPSFFRVPQFILDIVVGEMGKVATASQRVIPEKLMETDFRFKYVDLRSALNQILK